MARFLALDLGAESGRAALGTLHGGLLAMKALHRFPNGPVPVLGTLYWDILHLWNGVLDGLHAACDLELDGIGLDTWAVDFALLDESGKLLDNPVHQRDPRNAGMIEAVCAVVPKAEIYNRTGIQFMQINTLYQLYAMVRANAPALRHAATFLTIADLLNYWLTGRKVVEFSSATATQFYDPIAGDWARDLLERLGIPTAMLPEVVPPGTILGPLKAPVPNLEGVTPVIAPVTHDTGSAVAAVPAEGDRFAYISLGTWALMGAEVQQPHITPAGMAYNFTNEGGAAGTYRLLKNSLGLWLVQECRRTWATLGEAHDYDALTEMAADAPAFGPLLDPDPDSPHFLTPGDMPARIVAYCAQTGQPAPQTRGQILRCILESLALKFRQTLAQLEHVLGHEIEVIHIVGGGARNALLCQLTADACNRPVVAGPAEATSAGNIMVQAIATGHLASVAEGRAMVRRSFDLTRYEPNPSAAWDAAYARFLDLVSASA
ncbi:MAG: rhamnulokinase [Anaerolineae bacterium]|nr:rhamnulokinase [Anaerolineae bacterium]